MNYGIKKRQAQTRLATKHKSGRALFTDINLVEPTQVIALSTLKFIRIYARFGFLTRTDDDFFSFSLNI